MTAHYWLKDPTEEMRAYLADTHLGHISEEFATALLEEHAGTDDKRELDTTLGDLIKEQDR